MVFSSFSRKSSINNPGDIKNKTGDEENQHNEQQERNRTPRKKLLMLFRQALFLTKLRQKTDQKRGKASKSQRHEEFCKQSKEARQDKKNTPFLQDEDSVTAALDGSNATRGAIAGNQQLLPAGNTSSSLSSGRRSQSLVSMSHEWNRQQQDQSTRPSIRILVFRGVGGVYNTEHPLYGENALIRTGHVAMAGIIPGRIIGFSPTARAAKKVGGMQECLKLLREGIAQVGQLQDDTRVFMRAAQLAAQGHRCKVYQMNVTISSFSLEMANYWYESNKTALYNFPGAEGNFGMIQYNCATYWSQFDMEMISVAGYIKNYIGDMEERGATPWPSVEEWQLLCEAEGVDHDGDDIIVEM